MTWIMKSFFITLAVLFLWRVEEGAEACTCLNISPQQNICRSGFVIRASITGSEEVGSGTMSSTKYNIYPFQVFRGPKIDAIYTSGPCRAFMNNAIGQDYLLTGQVDSNGVAHNFMCNFKKPWNDLSDNELNLIGELTSRCSARRERSLGGGGKRKKPKRCHLKFCPPHRHPHYV
ncbi:metalloproteinase inhibitor 2 [Austrofundulus limnaeus]|uniref:Metalloproteinase inhibitor 2 n=1 Tax=Austrofundulus limnaeus TaxID=52670 RepID=A0A2I4CGT5_AUSLI|nr:PREDICTED: metalloproteinase inhibitor 2-like [Austrofundulus limnaeus]